MDCHRNVLLCFNSDMCPEIFTGNVPISRHFIPLNTLAKSMNVSALATGAVE